MHLISLKVRIVYQIFIIVCLLPSTVWAQGSLRVDVGRFSQIDISGWKIRIFVGATDYSLTNIDGVAIMTDSDNSGLSAAKPLF